MKVTNGERTWRIRKDGEYDQRFKETRGKSKKRELVNKEFKKPTKKPSRLRKHILVGSTMALVAIMSVKTGMDIALYIKPAEASTGRVEIYKPVVESELSLGPSYCEKDEITKLFCNPEYKWDAETMIAICLIENGYQLRGHWKTDMEYWNTNGSVDRGICSINSIHGYDKQTLNDPVKNVEIAYEIWEDSGYNAWYVYLDGRYLQGYEILNNE